jgi:hypothetical protein
MLSSKKSGELIQRGGAKGNSSQSWVENTNMTDCTVQYLHSMNSDKYLPQSPFTGKLLEMTTFYFGVYIAN